VTTFKGIMAVRDNVHQYDKVYLKVTGKIIGVSGFAQIGGTGKYQPIGLDSGIGTVYYELSDVGPSDQKCLLRSADTSNKATYRVAIFHTDE